MRSAPWHAASSEERERRFIAADIEQALICLDLAEKAAARARPDWRRHLVENAMHAHAEAERRLAAAEACGSEMGALRERLRVLRDTLAGMDQERREAA